MKVRKYKIKTLLIGILDVFFYYLMIFILLHIANDSITLTIIEDIPIIISIRIICYIVFIYGLAYNLCIFANNILNSFIKK